MSHVNTNLASEFWFFSQLHRLGYNPFITLGNTKAVDIAIKLKDGTTLSFDVKGKESFSRGTYPYLPDDTELQIKGCFTDSHYFVFVDLGISINKDNMRTILDREPRCFFIKSINLKNIARKWFPANGGNGGYGFDPKLLWLCKQSAQNDKISNKVIDRLKKDYDIEEIKKVIMTLAEFEETFHGQKRPY